MNTKDIIRMAREAGWDDHHAQFDTRFQTFAALVASAERERIESRPWGAGSEWIVRAVEAEREACANICETLELPEWPDKVRQPLAQAIRARGQA